MKDSLIKCARCGSDACYHQTVNKTYSIDFCYGCGFTTNSLMTEDSEFLTEQIEVLPELYKDLTFKDDKGNHWIPSTMNITDKGMIFANGKTSEEWMWTAVKAIPLLEEELDNFPDGSTHKMDMKNAKHFRERDFMEALDYIGLFNPTIK